MTISEVLADIGAACVGAVAGFLVLRALTYDDAFPEGGLATVYGALFGAPAGFVLGGAICHFAIIVRRSRGS